MAIDSVVAMGTTRAQHLDCALIFAIEVTLSDQQRRSGQPYARHYPNERTENGR